MDLGTSRRSVRCACPRGHRFVTSLLTCVDLSTDAQALETLCVGGTQLVRCPGCGSVWPVAEPVVLLDPVAERAALFVPEVIAHTELEVLGGLLMELSRDGAEKAPAYAADMIALVGEDALRSWRALPVERRPKTGVGGAVSVIPRIHSAFADLADPERGAAVSTPPPMDEESTDEMPEPEEDWLDDREIGAESSRKPSRPASVHPVSERLASQGGPGVNYVDLMSDADEEHPFDEFGYADEDDDGGDDDGGDDDGPDEGFGFGRRI